MLKGHKPLKGDTLIEVMFAVAIFGLAAVGTIALMNRGLASTQNSLETTMARQEIDAQAEALRFLHNAYLSEPKKSEATSLDQVCTNPTSYRDLWKCLTSSQYTYTSSSVSTTGSVTSEDPDFYTRTTTPGHYCDDLFHTNSTTSFSVPSKSFVLNPRALDISDLDTADDITNVLKKTIVTNDVQATRINLAGTYPRLLYGDSISTDDGNFSDATIGNGNKIVYGNNKKILQSAEGIWVTSVASPSGVQCTNEDGIRPDYYDFHIQTCWDSAASNSASTIKSTVRLFNPDQVSLTSKKSRITFANSHWSLYDDYCTEQDSEACLNRRNRHVELSTNDDEETSKLKFTGDGSSWISQGAYMTISSSGSFSISADIDPSVFYSHPMGYFMIKIGPLQVLFWKKVNTSSNLIVDFILGSTTDNNGSPVTKPLTSIDSMYQSDDLAQHLKNDANIFETANCTSTWQDGDAPCRLQNSFSIPESITKFYMEKNGDTYTVTLTNGDNVHTATANIHTDYDVQVAFWLRHTGHGCDQIYKVFIDNIIMEQPDATITSSGNCYHVDAATNQNSINLGDDQRDGSQDQTGSEPEEPEPAATEISVTSNNQRLSYVFESDSFMGQTIGLTVPTFSWGYWSDQWGSSNWEEISASSENIHLRYGQLYPFPDYGSTMPETFIIYTTSSLPKAFAARVCSGGPDCYNSVTGSVAPQFGPLYRRDATGEGRTWVIAKIKHPANTSTFYFTPINKLTNADPSTFSSL